MCDEIHHVSITKPAVVILVFCIKAHLLALLPGQSRIPLH